MYIWEWMKIAVEPNAIFYMIYRAYYETLTLLLLFFLVPFWHGWWKIVKPTLKRASNNHAQPFWWPRPTNIVCCFKEFQCLSVSTTKPTLHLPSPSHKVCHRLLHHMVDGSLTVERRIITSSLRILMNTSSSNLTPIILSSGKKKSSNHFDEQYFVNFKYIIERCFVCLVLMSIFYLLVKL